MTVYRLSDRASFLLEKLAEANDQKPTEFLHNLINDYCDGLSFDGPAVNDPDFWEAFGKHTAPVDCRAPGKRQWQGKTFAR